jgi:hypothetical protein
MDGMINITGGSGLSVDIEKEKAWVNLALTKDNYFEMSTKLADFSLRVLDTSTASVCN